MTYVAEDTLNMKKILKSAVGRLEYENVTYKRSIVRFEKRKLIFEYIVLIPESLLCDALKW